MTTIEKLVKIQSELKAPKNQYNSFGKYNYRNAEDILEAVKPLAAAYGAVVLLTDEIVNIGNRYYIKATAKLKDNEGEIPVTAYAREEESKKGMDGSQVTGTASSYARKYALGGLFAIDDTKDADSQNNAENASYNGQKTPNKELTLAVAKTIQIQTKTGAVMLAELSDEQLNIVASKTTNPAVKKAAAMVIADRIEHSDEGSPFDDPVPTEEDFGDEQ